MFRYIKEKIFSNSPKSIWHHFLLYSRNIKSLFIKKSKNSLNFKEIVKNNLNTNRICKLLDDDDLKIWLMSDNKNIYIIIDNGNKLKILQKPKKDITHKIVENVGEYGKIIINGAK